MNINKAIAAFIAALEGEELIAHLNDEALSYLKNSLASTKPDWGNISAKELEDHLREDHQYEVVYESEEDALDAMDPNTIVDHVRDCGYICVENGDEDDALNSIDDEAIADHMRSRGWVCENGEADTLEIIDNTLLVDCLERQGYIVYHKDNVGSLDNLSSNDLMTEIERRLKR